MPLNAKTTNDVLIAIPAFNEVETIGELLIEIKNQYPNTDILVIDDGSHDGTAEIAQSHGCFFIQNKTNQGKGAALVKAFQFSKQKGYAWTITMDADLQHPVSSVKKFLAEINKDSADIILADRRNRTEKMPHHRQLSNGLTSILISLVTNSIRIKDSQCGFRAYRVTCLSNLENSLGGFQFESEILVILAKRHYRFAEIEIPTVYNDQKSSINFVKDTFLFIKFVSSCILRS